MMLSTFGAQNSVWLEWSALLSQNEKEEKNEKAQKR
jgi:hypothetical protein